jgi:predicted RNA-binding Zn ribbon-like protein
MVGTAELAFRWVGGRPSVDFTATLGKRGGQAFERLRDPGDLARWFHEAAMADDPPEVSARNLLQARELREALYTLLTTPDADLEVLNHWAARLVAGGQLERQAGKLRLRPPRTDVQGLFSLLARDGAALITSPLASRIRECGHEDCWLLFVDESRAGRRRWCSMETCGARTKMARYRTG